MRGLACPRRLPAPVLAFVVAGVFAAAPARAEDAVARPEGESSPSTPVLPEEEYAQAFPVYGGAASAVRTRASGNVQYDGPARIHEDRGEISRWRELMELEGTVPVRPRLDLKWGAQLEADQYDLTDPDRIAPGEGRLLEDAWLARAGLGLDARLGEAWGVSVAGAATSSGVPGADFADTLTYGGSLVLRHRFSSTFGLRLGVSVSTQMDGGLLVLPVAGIDRGAGTGNLRFGVRGNGVRVGYAVTPRLVAGVSARYDTRDWRLAPSDRVADGFFRDTRVPVGLDVEYQLRPHLSLGFEGGVNVYEEILVEDRHDHSVQHVDADPSLWVGLTLTWVF